MPITSTRPLGSDEQCDADEAGRDSRDGSDRQPDPVDEAVEQRHEQRHARDEQGRVAGRHALLGERDAAGVDDEQEPADDRRGAPLAAARPLGAHVPAPDRPAVEEQAGDQEPHREHQQRRQRPVGDRDREIGRAPDEVDGAECRRALHCPTLPPDFDKGKSS